MTYIPQEKKKNKTNMHRDQTTIIKLTTSEQLTQLNFPCSMQVGSLQELLIILRSQLKSSILNSEKKSMSYEP